MKTGSWSFKFDIWIIFPPQTKDFAMSELLSHLYSAANQEDLMEESADEVNKREELLKMYHSTKEALKIISKSNVIGELSLIIIVKRYNDNYELYCEPIKTKYFRYTFFPGLFFIFFLILAHLWWFGVLGLGSYIEFWDWGFQLMGFGACGVGPSGFFGLGLSI